MTWREKCVIRILLLVAAIVANGVEHLEGNRPVAEEIRHLANHISTWAKEVQSQDKKPESKP